MLFKHCDNNGNNKKVLRNISFYYKIFPTISLKSKLSVFTHKF